MTSTIVPLSSIKIPEQRQRETIDDLDGLKDSLGRLGLLHPLIVDADLNLIAGERRLTAARELGWVEIEVKRKENLTELETRSIELEENIRRQNLSWQEECQAVADLRQLRSDLTSQELAEMIGFSPTHISRRCSVAAALQKGDEQLNAASGLRGALAILERRRDRAKNNLLEAIQDLDLADPKTEPNDVSAELEPGQSPAVANEPEPVQAKPAPPAATIHNVSFLDWTPPERYNFLHCDLPYGLNHESSPQGKTSNFGAYADTEETYQQLCEHLVAVADRLLMQSAHAIFWTATREPNYTIARNTLEAMGFRLWSSDLIWHKTDNRGIVSDTQRGPRHVYETALFGIRGDRKIVRVVSDVYGCPMSKSIHASEKPIPMLLHFFRMLVDENTVMLDPTCGSGNAIQAAESLGAKSAIGLEIDPAFAEAAQEALLLSRRKANLSKDLFDAEN
jgi:ParB family transcriptional regulator, chromosome partitioning protein